MPRLALPLSVSARAIRLVAWVVRSSKQIRRVFRQKTWIFLARRIARNRDKYRIDFVSIRRTFLLLDYQWFLFDASYDLDIFVLLPAFPSSSSPHTAYSHTSPPLSLCSIPFCGNKMWNCVSGQSKDLGSGNSVFLNQRIRHKSTKRFGIDCVVVSSLVQLHSSHNCKSRCRWWWWWLDRIFLPGKINALSLIFLLILSLSSFVALSSLLYVSYLLAHSVSPPLLVT